MHHQYRPYNLERLYGTQHYAYYGDKAQLLPRALGRCQIVCSPQKGHLGPKTGSPFSAHISMVLLVARQVYIPFGVYGQPHVLTLG